MPKLITSFEALAALFGNNQAQGVLGTHTEQL